MAEAPTKRGGASPSNDRRDCSGGQGYETEARRTVDRKGQTLLSFQGDQVLFKIVVVRVGHVEHDPVATEYLPALLEPADEHRTLGDGGRDDRLDAPDVRRVRRTRLAVSASERAAAEVLTLLVLAQTDGLPVGRVDDDRVRLYERDRSEGGDLVEDALHGLCCGQGRGGHDGGRETGTVEQALEFRGGAVAVEEFVLHLAAEAEDHAVLEVRLELLGVLEHLDRRLRDVRDLRHVVLATGQREVELRDRALLQHCRREVLERDRKSTRL